MSYAHVPKIKAIDREVASKEVYDVVIVGSGPGGAIIAKQLGLQKEYRVLILEAGPANDFTLEDYNKYVQHFYSAFFKDNNAPYPDTPNARMPRSPETRPLIAGRPDATTGYFVQNGPAPLESTYAKLVGGTSMHWQASTPRMVPDDFEMRTRFGQGRDWPIKYDDLEKYYQMAEGELGVSADVEDQSFLGIRFQPDYVYPMHAMPMSFLDRQVGNGIAGLKIDVDGHSYPLTVRSIAQARNGVPNLKYNGGKGFLPVAAVSTHQTFQGTRCQGNNNCVPICPVQAKYDARKTLAAALDTGFVHIVAQTVVSQLCVDPATNHVTKLIYKHYKDPQKTEYEIGEVRGRVFVIAGNAVETPRLMLSSNLPSTSGLMGCNLMDHPYLLAWGLLPTPAGTMRGTQSTGGIEELRTGSFRKQQAAFRADIHNDGWGWATGSPYSDLLDLVDNGNKFAGPLRRGLIDRISRQLLLAFMIELPPERSNRVSVDPGYRDALDNPRPVISFRVTDYAVAGMAFARRVSQQIFQRLGVEDHTNYDPLDHGYVTYEGQGYAWRGGNHFAGTHVMGACKDDSVVDSWQHSWDHPNLYLAGAGSMCTIGTANTTLTLAALSFRTVEHLLNELPNYR